MIVDAIFTGAIPVRIQIIAIGASALLFLFIVSLIRDGRLKEGYAIIWFLISVGMLAISIFPRLLAQLARLVGISYAPSAFLLVLVGGLYLLAIHYSLILHQNNRRIRRLAQEHAILKEEISRNNKTI